MTKTGDAARPPLEPLDSASPTELFQRYQKPILIGVIVLGVAGGGLWLAQRSAQIKETRGGEALLLAESAYATGGPAAAQAELQKVYTRYAGTAAGTQAALLSAQWYYEAGQADSGLMAVEAGLAKAPAFQRSGLLAMQAAGKSMKGDHAGAAADFEAAAAATVLDAERDSYRMEAARAFVLAGDTASAERIYSDVAGREDSAYAGEARLRLGEIKAKA
jgi:predicted negative regulator of RcsB-dependent stress response